MSDIRKLLDTINEMATTSGSVATVASPMGGVKTRKKDSIFYEGEKCTSCGCESCKCDSSEGNAVDGTKTPDAPKVSEFGLWKNSALAGQEQREKKKSKKQVSEGEDLAWDDPDLVKARKLISAKKKDGHTEFKGIDKAVSKMKDKNARKHPVNEPAKVKENKASPYLGDREYNALDAVQDKLDNMAHRHKDEKWSIDQLKNLGKKLTASEKTKRVDELGNSLMPGGQRQLKLAEQGVDENLATAAKNAVKGAKRFMKNKPSVSQAISRHKSDARGAESKRDVFRVTGNSKLSSDMSQQANREHEKAARIKNKFAAESTTKRTKK